MVSGCPTSSPILAGMRIEICEIRPVPANPVPALSHQHPQPDQPLPDQNKRRPHPAPINPQLSLSDLIQIKSAEYWLILGDPDGAVRELEALSSTSWNHPWAVKVRSDALEVMGERAEAMVQK